MVRSSWLLGSLRGARRLPAIGITANCTFRQLLQARHIRPDILFAKRGEHALVLECKFPFETADPGYVAHGLYQAFFYAQQLASVFERVSAYSVGPTELVSDGESQVLNGVADIGIASSTGIETVVRRLLS